MSDSTVINILAMVWTAWLIASILSYAVIRVRLAMNGEPTGWRFNHHGANVWTGHLSFYQREGGHAVVLRSFKPFPVYWKVLHADMTDGEDLQLAKRAPAWKVMPWARRWMGNKTALAVMESGDTAGTDG